MRATCSMRSVGPWAGMATEIKLPRLGQGMESGTIVKWLKSEGDPVKKGEPLYELDTDKVTQEVEADASGVLLKIAISEGEVEVGKTIAVIGEQGEEVAVAAALMRHRAVNAHFAGDAVRLFPTADIGIAVATDRGLVVPVIRGCERRTIAEIAATRADLVERARSGKLHQADLEGGTFTISNLGMYGVEQFVAVLNPPQAAILAVGAVQETPV